MFAPARSEVGKRRFLGGGANVELGEPIAHRLIRVGAEDLHLGRHAQDPLFRLTVVVSADDEEFLLRGVARFTRV